MHITQEQRERFRWLPLALAIVLPLLLAVALVPFRDSIANANVALILAAAVVLVASLGRRPAAFVAAVSAVVCFDYFHTRPYESFRINSGDDLLTACVLLAVGIFVGELAVRSRRHRDAAAESSNDIARIHSVAELVAEGEPAEYLVMVVANELRDLLSLKDCRFEAQPGVKPMARHRTKRRGRHRRAVLGCPFDGFSGQGGRASGHRARSDARPVRPRPDAGGAGLLRQAHRRCRPRRSGRRRAGAAVGGLHLTVVPAPGALLPWRSWPASP